jgi:hypothetical protein
MMKRLKTFPPYICSVVLLATLCSTIGAQQSGSRDAHGGVLLFSTRPPGESDQLRSGDVLSVRVFGQPDLSAEVTVDERGVISLPFIDDVEAAGRTIAQLKNEVVLRYQKMLKRPQISVRVVEFTKTASVGVYAVYDNQGREVNIYTSMMNADGGRIKWEVQSLKDGMFRLSFFSNSFIDGRDKYEVTVMLDDGHSVSLGRAIKIHPTVVTAHNDPQIEVRLKVPLAALARTAQAREATMKVGDKAFKVEGNSLEALRFIVSHFSTPAP